MVAVLSRDDEFGAVEYGKQFFRKETYHARTTAIGVPDSSNFAARNRHDRTAGYRRSRHPVKIHN
jgi:hypothetical protein